MAAPDSIRHRLWACFRHGAFARYMGGEAVSMTGTWMQAMAQGWVMTGLTTSAVMLGLVNFATGLPMLALALKAGVLADRWDRRNILLVAQVLQIGLALLVGWLVARHQIQVWHIVTVAFFLGLVFAFEMPAVNAMVPELVHREEIATAIAIDRSVFHGTRLVGPAIAGYVVARWGEATAFFLNALSFLAMIAVLLSIRLPARSAEAQAAAQRGGIREGLVYVRGDRPTMAMLGLMALSTVCVFPVLVVMMPLYARHVLGLGADRMGWLMGLTALGSMTGALGLLAVPLAHRRSFLLASVAGVGVGLAGLSLAREFGSAVLALVLLALGVSSLVGLCHTVIQERAPNPLRGRVSAIAGLSFFGLMPFASLGVTGLADLVGIRPALAAGAVLYAGCALPLLLGRAGRASQEPVRKPPPPPAIPPAPVPPTESWG